MSYTIDSNTEIRAAIVTGPDGDARFAVSFDDGAVIQSFVFTQDGWHNLISAAEATFLLDAITARQESP